MRNCFLLGIIILIGLTSCNHKKEEVVKTNDNVSELKKYIDMNNIPIDNCIFEFSKRGVEKSRTEIGISDYQLIALLKYSQNNFNEVVKKIKKQKKYDNVYLNKGQIRTWFPDSLIRSFKNEEGYYYLDNSYSPDIYILKGKSVFKNGFCFIGNNKNILIYLYTD
jgi:hypothetical protein